MHSVMLLVLQPMDATAHVLGIHRTALTFTLIERQKATCLKVVGSMDPWGVLEVFFAFNIGATLINVSA